MSWHRRHIRASHWLGYRSAQISNFSHPSTSPPRGFHLKNGQRNCPEEGDTSALSLSGIKKCKYTTSKFLLEHNGGLGRQDHEMRKEGGRGGCKTKVDVEPVRHYGFTENLLHLISCPRVFQFEHKMPPGEFRQWAREETGEGKRRGRKMRA